MSNDLVVQLGAKLDQFAGDMNQAGDMADSAVSPLLRIQRATAKPRASIPAEERQRAIVSRSLLNCHVSGLAGIVRRFRRAMPQTERDAAKSSFSPHDAADKDCGMAVERQHKFVANT
jgi:hypothetical protein